MMVSGKGEGARPCELAGWWWWFVKEREDSAREHNEIGWWRKKIQEIERKNLGKDALETHHTLSIVRTWRDRRDVSAGAPAGNVSLPKMTGSIIMIFFLNRFSYHITYLFFFSGF